MRLRILHLVFCALLFGIPSFCYAQMLEDFNDRWEYGGLGTWFESHDRISQELDLKAFPKANIYLEVPEKTVVFVGEKLWFYTDSDTVVIREVDSVYRELGLEKIQLTLFKEGIRTDQVYLAKIIGSELLRNAGKSSIDGVELRNQDRQKIRDFFIVSLLVILIMTAIYKMAYPYIFGMMLQPRGLLSDEDFSDVGSLQKFFSLDVVFYVFIVNLLLSLLSITSLLFFRPDVMDQIQQSLTSSLYFLWVIGGFFFLGLTVLKFLGIRLVAFLFDLGRMEYAHFFYLLRLIVWSGMVVMLVVAYSLLNSFYNMEFVLDSTLNGFFWFYLLGVSVLFFMMMNRLSFKKYHLFTYLCIAELVPFLVFSKWIMGLGQF
ncbi:DUF4271 domain-containing protein [Algoriphagus hitonicola]|uniref:DUF4271 domain-containing protein n=1 Tax=Algoriphagus hitonicola TaxID=435880 RepID=A0A1I2W2A0_9BACT|nr:DUF4271 domain-containing protein [Algoriphagus hitonicola]SFG94186.1 protein of unknown function [Algoriphagus hitonicola]